LTCDRFRHKSFGACRAILSGEKQLYTQTLKSFNKDQIVRTARAKGLKERLVIMKHGLRNALIPLITILAGLYLGRAMMPVFRASGVPTDYAISPVGLLAAGAIGLLVGVFASIAPAVFPYLKFNQLKPREPVSTPANPVVTLQWNTPIPNVPGGGIRSFRMLGTG
jgi:hypothetical protein